MAPMNIIEKLLANAENEGMFQLISSNKITDGRCYGKGIKDPPKDLIFNYPDENKKLIGIVKKEVREYLLTKYSGEYCFFIQWIKPIYHPDDIYKPHLRFSFYKRNPGSDCWYFSRQPLKTSVDIVEQLLTKAKNIKIL